MAELGKKILNKIKSEAIKPCPRWKFLLKNYSWWLAGAASMFVGSLSFSVVFYMLANNDWDIYHRINVSLAKFIFLTLPYFWLTLLALFIILADYYLRHTKRGYRFSLFKIVGASVILSVILGGIFYYGGVAAAIESALSRAAPSYNKLIFGPGRIWLQPEKGLLAGTIITLRNNGFLLKDFNGQIWEIKTESALIHPPVNLIAGARVKIIGQKQGQNKFIAQEIRPLFGKSGHCWRRHSLNHNH